MPEAALAAGCQCDPVVENWQELRDRAVALGLLEVSPGEAIRVPRILDRSLDNDGLDENRLLVLNNAAAAILYRLWWQEAEGNSSEQALELVRLGLLAKNQEIAVEVGDSIATYWVNRSRYGEALALCSQILEVFQDYRIFGAIARAEVVLGLVDEAIEHYESALAQCPDDDVQGKAASLHMMATRLWQNTSKVHFDTTVRPDGRLLIYGGHIISMARSLSFNGLANAQMLAGINAGAHANPSFAGTTLRAWSEVLDKAETAAPGVGAIRLRLVAVKAGAAPFALKGEDGKYLSDVLLDFDYWALMPL